MQAQFHSLLSVWEQGGANLELIEARRRGSLDSASGADATPLEMLEE